MPRTVAWTSAFLIFLTFITFFGLQLNSQHGWSDDGSGYLLHAKSLAEGRPYHAVNVAATPNYKIAFVDYPPALPLLLAPMMRLRGVDFNSCKILMFVIFSLCLALLPFVFRGYLKPWQILALVVVFGANPQVFTQVEHINSDLLFLLFLILFLIATRAGLLAPGGRRRWLLLSASVCVFVLVLMTRSTALALVPGVVLYLLVTGDRRRSSWLFTAALVACTAASLILIGGSYSGSLTFYLSYPSVRRNLIQYPLALGELFGGGAALSVALWLLALAGAVIAWRRGPSLWDALAPPFAALLIIWPFSDPLRFGLPLIPLVLAWCLIAVGRFFSVIGGRGSVLTASALSLALATSYVAAYRHRPETGGIFAPKSRELWNYVRTSVNPDAVIVFSKARTLTLLTGRRGIDYAAWVPPGGFWDEICAVHPTHIIAAPRIFENDRQLLIPAVQAHSGDWSAVFSNGDFAVYALHAEACAQAGPAPRVQLPSRFDRNYPLP